MNGLTPSSLHGAARSPWATYTPSSAQAPGAVPPSGSGGFTRGNGRASDFGADRLQGAFSPDGSGPTASAGHMWRLLGLGHGGSSAASPAHASTPRGPKSPAPSKPHAAAPHNSSGGHAPTVTAPVILIGNNPTPGGGLIPGTPGAPTGPGTFPVTPGPGGHPAPVGGPGLSTTPEPASVLLLGTGLIGLAALLRRKNA